MPTTVLVENAHPIIVGIGVLDCPQRWEGSQSELFLPSLMLASRQRLSSEMRTQSKFENEFGDGFDNVTGKKRPKPKNQHRHHATIREGSLRELISPDLFLASRERSWSKLRTQFAQARRWFAVRRHNKRAYHESRLFCYGTRNGNRTHN